jgi:hypothetical protein
MVCKTSDINLNRLLKNHPYTRPSSRLPEKTPECQVRYWYSLHAPQNRSDAHSFYWFRLKQFALIKQSSSWGSFAGGPFYCRQGWYMNLSDSARVPIFPRVSANIGCHTISRVYKSETVRAHYTQTCHWGLERTWQFDTTSDSPFQQNYEELSHTYWCISGNCSWWDDRKRNQKPVLIASLPSLKIFQQSQLCTFLLSPFAFLTKTSGPENAS